MITHYANYINGEFKDSKEKQKIINPSTGEAIASAALATSQDAELAIASARIAYDSGPWPKITLHERKEFLLKISQGILNKAGELANLETLNTGKPIKEATFMDIPSAAKAFEYLAHNFEHYLIDEDIQISNQISQAEAKLVREPVGVVALIVPWNYPLLIACWKLASALAAGNTVILKPSSLTPLSVLELAKIIHEAGLPKGVVNIINGSGSKLGEMLCTDRWVDMISFTGSNEVGKQIMQKSSQHIKKLVMELGGKSASIVLSDADLDAAVNGSLCSIFLNQGQMCTAMSRIFVEDKIYERFLDTFTERARRIKLGPGVDFETQMGPLISEEQRCRVISQVEKARYEGAKILCGGRVPEDYKLQNGFFFEPTVITDVAADMGIFREEVFGPVVCISRFSNMDEAVILANYCDFGLAACIWTKDEKSAEELARRLNAGAVWVNTYGMFYNEVPYGGFKQSGFGKELGREGFLEYMRLKTIIIDKTKEAKPLVNYWYGF